MCFSLLSVVESFYSWCRGHHVKDTQQPSQVASTSFFSRFDVDDMAVKQNVTEGSRPSSFTNSASRALVRFAFVVHLSMLLCLLKGVVWQGMSLSFQPATLFPSAKLVTPLLMRDLGGFYPSVPHLKTYVDRSPRTHYFCSAGSQADQGTIAV